MIGTTLRQYVIKSPLGRGGMGEVWLARDTTLDRDVALKILPPDTSGDAATRKERFFREAKAASALNHPNIVTIHEINARSGVRFHRDGTTSRAQPSRACCARVCRSRKSRSMQPRSPPPSAARIVPTSCIAT